MSDEELTKNKGFWTVVVPHYIIKVGVKSFKKRIESLCI